MHFIAQPRILLKVKGSLLIIKLEKGVVWEIVTGRSSLCHYKLYLVLPSIIVSSLIWSSSCICPCVGL